MKKSVESLKQEFIDTKDDKRYRHAYADESLNMTIATQIKILREQRGWGQQQLAAYANMKQSMISRYEDVNYSSWTINTLKKLAEAFDVIVDVRFRSFRDLIIDTCIFSRESLQVQEFTKDPFFKETKEETVADPVAAGVGKEAASILYIPVIGASTTQEEPATSIAMHSNPASQKISFGDFGGTASELYQ